MLIFDSANQVWWLRLPLADGKNKEYSLPTWLAQRWIEMGMAHRTE